MTPGVPLLSLVDLNDIWLRFDLREDLVKSLKLGDKIAVRIPALGDRRVEAEVKLIAAKGEYAGWRATRATGDFDLRTFAVRAYPVERIPELRPGIERLCRLAGGGEVRRPAAAGLCAGRRARAALDPARSAGLLPAGRRAADRLPDPRPHLQQRRHPQSQHLRGRCPTRPRPRAPWFSPVSAAPGISVSGRVEDLTAAMEGDPFRQGDRRGVYPGEFRARSPGRPAGRRSRCSTTPSS